MIPRGLSATLLVIFAMQLLGGMALASVCPDPCPDDASGTGCPPICALCTSCTHAQPGIVQQSASSTPSMPAHRFVPQQPAASSLQLAADIFHVPLLG